LNNCPASYREDERRALNQPRGAFIMKKAYTKPVLRRLGLLRQVTRFSF
jgi:hypothetical protein